MKSQISEWLPGILEKIVSQSQARVVLGFVTNATIQNGGVTLRGNASSSWIEIADVRSGLGASGVDGGTRNVTFIGYGNGSTIVGMNFLSNQTAQFTGSSPNTTQNVTLVMPFLLRGTW